MKKTTFAWATVWCIGVVAFGLCAFIAGGLVGRLHISPLVGVVDSAESGARTLAKTLKGQASNVSVVTSGYYHLKITSHPTTDTPAGDNVGFSRVADGYLLGQRGGGLKFARIQPDGSTEVVNLATTIPTNKDVFAVEGADYNSRLHTHFGAKDVFVQEVDSGLRLFATHHFWKSDERCVVLRLSMLEASLAELLDGSAANSQWRTLYDSTPCSDLQNKLNRAGEDNALLGAGGRLALLSPDELLMTVGAHSYDSIYNVDLVQDATASYGKTILLNLADGTARHFTQGHYNPQGLYVDNAGNVWSAEHGPRGGDEINLLEEGGNYGWPIVSYGTEFDLSLPDHLSWAGHEGYRKPVFSWLPTIAAGNVIRLENSALPLWEGNLMLATLRDRALHRLILDGSRVVLDDRIEIGDRIRDLTQTPEGELLLMTDNGDLLLVQALGEGSQGADTTEARTAKLWMACATCHSVEAGGGHKVGPNLHNILGKDIARFDDFQYTAAMDALEGQWTEEALHAFLEDPQAFAPGTSMAFEGYSNREDRELIIQYLRAR